ncbi:C6 transcription factor [Colletotrichum truncatum]|uniref:C6 transcription factor n=1 Tax=Colletotrichum truncatum TaxID=5467 RepID=A0ACC3ZGF9_COLTU
MPTLTYTEEADVTTDIQSPTAQPSYLQSGHFDSWSDRSASTNKKARSCLPCNKRKVRCDKKSPCSLCIRCNRTCVYPPPGQPIRRPRKTTIADVASRLSHLERSVVAKTTRHDIPTQLPPTENVSPSGDPLTEACNLSGRHRSMTRPASVNGLDGDHGGQGFLIHRGSSTQYFNDVLLSTVVEGDQDVKSALSASHNKPISPPVSSPFDPMGLLSTASSTIPLTAFQPSKKVAMKLWKAYNEKVESLAGNKLLHVPSDEVIIFTAINDPSKSTTDDLMLCFAIYCSAATALCEDEVEKVLEESRETSFMKFKTGLEQSLTRGGFLGNPSFRALQALAIYLATLRVYNPGKSIWILHGIVIRAAQSIGLHRDGERLGLTPYQAEMRRRLWWYLVTRDWRASEDYGLENANAYLSNSVNLPLNIDDVDLHPDMTELPSPKRTWTAMTMPLIFIDISMAIQQLSALAAGATSSNDVTHVKIMSDVRAKVESRLEQCNSVIPRHRLTIMFARFMLCKLDLITRLRWAMLSAGSSSDTVTDGIFTDSFLLDAVKILEQAVKFGDDELLKPYLWSAHTYTQYQVTLYVLWHLCLRPNATYADRAWVAVEGIYLIQMKIVEGRGAFEPRLTAVNALRDKARRLREQRAKLHAITSTSLHNVDEGDSAGVGDTSGGNVALSDTGGQPGGISSNLATGALGNMMFDGAFFSEIPSDLANLTPWYHNLQQSLNANGLF